MDAISGLRAGRYDFIEDSHIRVFQQDGKIRMKIK